MVKDLALFVLAGVVVPTIVWTLLGRQRHAQVQEQSGADAGDMARMDSDKG